MKHYAVFINGVRGGTITFNNTDNGEELKRKLLTLSPTVNLREIDETDRCYREAHPSPRINNSVGIGGQMVRKMIEAYEGKRR